MKRFIFITMCMVIICTGFAFATGSDEDGVYVGIAMPTQSSTRWISDGNSMKEQMEALSYKVDLQYGEDIIENQVAQIENMITKGVQFLVIAAIDGESLTSVLEKANENGIRVIAYDRLIRNSQYVDYYVTFDNFKVGIQQATTLVEGLGLENNSGPFNIELFAGSPDDNNAYFFYDGAMSVLQPYVDSGVLVIRSGQVGMDKVATLRWDGATAQARMDNLLSAFYTDASVDAILSPYDGISIGIISSVKGVGYGQGGKGMPYISGQDAELPSVKSILADEQYSTIFKDTRSLAERATKIVEAMVAGEDPEVNDTTTYENGVKIVPSYLLQSIPVKKDNIESALIDTGYYERDDIY